MAEFLPTNPVAAAITDEASLAGALDRVQVLMSLGADRTPREDRELEIVAALIEQHELKDWPTTPSPLHEVVLYHMEQRGLTPDDLVSALGDRENVDAILSGRTLPSVHLLPGLGRLLKVSFAHLAASYGTAAA